MSTKRNTDFEIIILGAGSGGLTAAVGLARVGKKVLLIEKNQLGGECTNSGCIPSKALLSFSKDYKKEVPNFESPFQYTNTIVTTVRTHESDERLARLGITVLYGTAEFVDKKTIAVNDTLYQFKKAIIATGSRARSITIEGVNTADILTNENFFTQRTLPKHIAIIGGGPIGLELAEACCLLGSTVSVIEKNHTVLSNHEPLLTKTLTNHLEKKGVSIFTDCTNLEAENTTLTFTSKKSLRSVPYEKILVAIGRQPNLPNGLKNAGVATADEHIVTDTHSKTTNGNIFAVGDVTLTKKYTHTAEAGARSVVAQILTKGIIKTVKHSNVPNVLYTTPEFASVGLTSTEAEAAYGAKNIHTIKIPLTKLDRAITEDAHTGTAIIIVRRLSGKILGAHLLMPHAGELISYFTLAIDNKLSLFRLAKTIFPYPTYSQIITKAADEYIQLQRTSLREDVRSRIKHTLPYLAIATIWVTLVVLIWYWFTDSTTSEIETLIALLTLIASTVWGPLLFVLLYSLRPLVLFPATWLTILAGSFFGFQTGLLLTLIGATGSALVAYSVARWFNRNYTPQDVADLSGWKHLLRNHTFESTLFMRLSFLPFDPISYLAGALKLPPVQFITASLIGIIPGSATFVALGASVDLKQLVREGVSTSILDVSYIFMSLGIFIVALFISYIARVRQARKTKKISL